MPECRHNLGRVFGLVRQLGKLFNERRQGAREIVVTSRQSDFDAFDLSDQSIAHDLRAVMKILFGPLPRAGLPDEIELLDGLHDGLLFGNRARQRFLAVDIFSVLRRLARDQCVPMIRHGRRAAPAQGAGGDDRGRGGRHAGDRDKMSAGEFGTERSGFHSFNDGSIAMPIQAQIRCLPNQNPPVLQPLRYLRCSKRSASELFLNFMRA